MKTITRLKTLSGRVYSTPPLREGGTDLCLKISSHIDGYLIDLYKLQSSDGPNPSIILLKHAVESITMQDE